MSDVVAGILYAAFLGLIANALFWGSVALPLHRMAKAVEPEPAKARAVRSGLRG
jgi:hypothetical protein